MNEKVSQLARLGIFLFSVGLSLPGSATQADNSVRLDNSDWWSLTRSSKPDEIEPQKRELAAPNFLVLGVNLGETMFRRAAARLGNATIIERGDASTGRRQVCYVSPGKQHNVHVVFEQGELKYTFYLFVGGPGWEGADRCVDSKAIPMHLATGSGIRLGQTPAQVMAILGKTTKRRKNELVYFFLVRKKTSPQDLKEARERNPDISDKDFQETYSHYDLTADVVARFVGSKLTYLAVSKVESN